MGSDPAGPLSTVAMTRAFTSPRSLVARFVFR